MSTQHRFRKVETRDAKKIFALPQHCFGVSKGVVNKRVSKYFLHHQNIFKSFNKNSFLRLKKFLAVKVPALFSYKLIVYLLLFIKLKRKKEKKVILYRFCCWQRLDRNNEYKRRM